MNDLVTPSEKDKAALEKERLLGREEALSEKAQRIKEAPWTEKTIKVEEEEKTAKIPQIKKAEELKKPKKAEKEKISPLPTKKEKPLPEEKKQLEPKQEIAYQTLELSPIIQAQAETLAAKIDPHLNPEIIPILEHMIGAMIQFTNKDISKTQIILNNPKFANSRFYNSKITFEKYATAPDSYNIILTGSDEAVTVFNENIEGLYKRLSDTDLNFEIGRLSAEYERPLFRRKVPPGDFERDTQSR